MPPRALGAQSGAARLTVRPQRGARDRSQLLASLEGNDEASVELAVIQRARGRLEALEKRESLGLGSLTTPNEFLCPITQDVMIDPVVASDGHSYERSAIQAILERGSLDGGSALSPLTREELETSLVPNINLRKRIREHGDTHPQGAALCLSPPPPLVPARPGAFRPVPTA